MPLNISHVAQKARKALQYLPPVKSSLNWYNNGGANSSRESKLKRLDQLMRKGYRLIEHTADMGIEARAESCSKVMELMARGLAIMLFGDSPVSDREVNHLLLKGEDRVELMVEWLNEILYWCEQNNLIPAEFHIDALKNGELLATLSGEPFNPQRHHVERQVKAITYHQARLEEVSGGWYARVYVDL